MTETESITVAEVSEGPCGSGRPGTAVDLPVVELLTGRGFVTGKSGSGKSNTASVVAEKLLDNGFGLLVVDIDGEYYGLKEEYEILHAGADEECDIQVTVDHAEKLATLALEKNVPIILDVSSFLDEAAASELLTEVAKQLFAKAKKLKQPFLLLVEEVHEYIPQQGSVDECGKMLIKISKRGRKHGLGVVGISQRPADVKKDFITQCDWLVWHRLTWNNDTKVVSRILDADYASAVEDLNDGEAFLMTDWSERVQRVQFQRKTTFDAGATPGLDDFERPDLKSVSDDLVSELETISEQKRETEDRIVQLREELDDKNSRIAELEAELQDARDMRRMADQFTQAMIEQVGGPNPGRTERERMADRRQGVDEDVSAPKRRENGNDDGALTWPGEGEFGATDADEGDADATGDDLFGMAGAFDDSGEAGGAGLDASGGNARSAPDGGTATATLTSGFSGLDENPLGDRATDAFERGTTTGQSIDVEDGAAVAGQLADVVSDLEPKTRGMLRYYRDHGPGTPMDALFAAGGTEDRTAAYARNRRLRVRGLVEHVGRGRYDYRVDDLLREETGLDSVRAFVEQVETALSTED